MNYDEEVILASLKAFKVNILTSYKTSDKLMNIYELLKALTMSKQARFRLAIIPLILRCSDAIDDLSVVLSSLDDPERRIFKYFYTAGVYLQRLWWTTLNLYLKQTPLADLFSAELDLPKADQLYGRMGIFRLSERLQEESGIPYNYLASFEHTMDLFFESLKSESKKSS